MKKLVLIYWIPGITYFSLNRCFQLEVELFVLGGGGGD